MLDPIVIKQLRDKYCDIHPLMFHRSLQKATSNGDLFDILSTIPEKYPVNWNPSERRWINIPEVEVGNIDHIDDLMKKIL